LALKESFIYTGKQGFRFPDLKSNMDKTYYISIYLLYMETAITAGWGIGKGTSSLSNSASNANVDQGNGFFLKYKTYNFLSGLFYGTGNIVPKEM